MEMRMTMSMTESYLTILESSLDKKIEILDSIEMLNTEQEKILNAASFDEEAFNRIVEQKAELVEKLNAMDEGFQLVYNNVKAELDGNKDRYAAEIKRLQGKITQVMEKSSHLMAEEQRNKDRVTAKFASRRKEIGSVKKNQQYAANYYKTMNKVTSEPVFMDKKK